MSWKSADHTQKEQSNTFFSREKIVSSTDVSKNEKKYPPRPSRFYLGLMLSDRPDVMQTSLCLFLENAVNNQILFI